MLATSSNQDLEDAPVVAAPSEEEVALAWRPKDSGLDVARRVGLWLKLSATYQTVSCMLPVSC